MKVHSKDVKLDETVDFEEIALATSGAVGADLANMMNEAAITAVKNGRKAVSQKDLFEAVELVLVGKEKKDRILSQEERRIVSYHEVGHALVSALQKDSEPVQKITIVPRTMGALGYVMQVPEEEKFLNTKKELEEVRADLAEWENQKEPQPERSEAVIRNRKRLDALGIPYQEFYKVIEFGDNLEEEACNRLEEALLKMGILDALVIDEQYKEQVLKTEKGCEDHYLFICKNSQKNLQPDRSLLDVLELNEEVNDIFSNQRLTGILGSIAYDSESLFTVAEDGTYGMGVLAGTVTGEYEAGFLGTKAREKHRQAKIEECRQRITGLEAALQQLEEMLSLIHISEPTRH